MTISIACVVGTRPEAVKMAPVIRRLQSEPHIFETRVVSTGQHGSLLTDVFEFFNYHVNVSLDLMVPNQTLSALTARAADQLGNYFCQYKPDWVLVQGDTTSAFVASYCAFLVGAKVAHVEAGLRTYKKYSPFPEEMNRKLIGSIADLHFAPTHRSVLALEAEGVTKESIHLTGNTIVDALHLAEKILQTKPVKLMDRVVAIADSRRYVLVTSHRRENHETGIGNICTALKRFVLKHPEYQVLFQVHPNPVVKSLVTKYLNDSPGVTLIEPQSYGSFVRLMSKAHFILTDSGGIQEEGPSLGKPVLVARDGTERPEGLEAGCNELVGTDVSGIINGLCSLAEDKDKYTRMSQMRNPFGDGHAADRIAELLKVKM